MAVNEFRDILNREIDDMKKINVNLYGGKSIFGGREKPLEADTIYCDNADRCSLYKEGKCLRVRQFGSIGCKYGQTVEETGYTSRARKYWDFRSTYANDECYNKLNSVGDAYFAVIGDWLLFGFTYVFVSTDKETGSLKIHENFFGNKFSFIKKEKCTADFLKKVFDSQPRTFFDNQIIKDYRSKVIPEIMAGIKKEMPELYMELIDLDASLGNEPNYTGKTAYINTMVDGSKIKDHNGNVFLLSDGKLTCKNYNSHFLPFGANCAEIVIPVTDKMTYKIDDNSQVNENTRFM